ncbi:SPOR domain-containing protein [Vibrio mytili]|uniref:SPOR domain-containing protein n=1 Tax=Vibrio mytili TaxID=50718 RepID=UPI002F3F50D6
MEMKKAPHPFRLIQSSLSLGVLLICAQLSPPALADEFLCQATQASDKQLPVLEQSCPIGKGVWGKKVPTGNPDFYWIQCGLLPKPMSLAKAKPIYSKITTDVWMKPESNGYRCLIGPYTSFSSASTDLRSVKTLSSYKEAFIRVVGQNHAQVSTQNQSAEIPTPAAVSAARANTDAFKETTSKTTANQSTSSTPQSEKAKSATVAPVAKSKLSSISNEAISVRLKTVLQGKTYVVPYLVENHNQFYMEYGKPWNRLNYMDATRVCQQIGMTLATEAEFKQLRNSGVMEKNNWPIQLPYWGKDRKGLFMDRDSNQLTGTSLLNVMCVQ